MYICVYTYIHTWGGRDTHTQIKIETHTFLEGRREGGRLREKHPFVVPLSYVFTG